MLRNFLLFFSQTDKHLYAFTCRKSWTHNGDSDRPVKRLFTPEIKKLLKDWLIRRRENPYPSRDEKKALAVETGLTYTQICNWFANWRRKLKNTSAQKKSWCNLIKNYNVSAKGNVEQFSICSADSIWGEHRDRESLGSASPTLTQNSDSDGAQDLSRHAGDLHFDEGKFAAAANGGFMLPASPFFQAPNSPFAGLMAQAQCFHISSTTGDFQFANQKQQQQFFPNAASKFKNHIMEKYLRGLDDESNNNNNCDTIANKEAPDSKKPELSKWLESTANFQPSKNNYNIDFKNDKKRSKSSSSQSIHEKELIAAETLVLLKNNFRTRFYNS